MKNQLRSLEQLERDMEQNEVNRWSAVCHHAIAAGNASDAAAFARAAIRASRRLEAAEKVVQLAERQAEPMLRLVNSACVGEIARAYAGDAPLRADMLSELEVAA